VRKFTPMNEKIDNAIVQYGVRWNPRPAQVPKYALLCAVLSGISIVLSWLAVLAVPGGFLGVGAFYFASIFYALSTYWFGGWGLIASFIGALIGSGVLTGMPIIIALPFAVADIWEPLLPFLLLRLVGPKIGIDPLGANLLSKDKPLNFVLFVIFGAAIPPFISGLWGSWILVRAGFVPPTAFWVSVLSWWFGAAILLTIFVPAFGKALGRFVRRSNLACVGIWS
jgi:hypothetical protein